MATNFEFYKDEILEIANKDDDFGVVNGKIVNCCAIECEKCLFRICSGLCSTISKINWLYAEHIEQPKLTKRERAFCEVAQTGWIARDKSGELYWFAEGFEVDKLQKTWSSAECSKISTMGLRFCFVKWEDEKPWAVEDLLKLDVRDEVREDA